MFWYFTCFCCCYSVSKSCLTLWGPIDYSTPGYPIHHQLPGPTQTQVHCIDDAIHPTISSSVSPFSSCLQSFPESGSFPMCQSFTSGGQSIGGSALALVLPMNIQDWVPLGLTGWIALQSQGLSRVFSNTTQFKNINSSTLSFLYSPTLTSTHDFWKNQSFD